MRPALTLLALPALAVPLTACGACEPSGTAPTAADASASAVVSAAPSTHPSAILPHKTPQPKLACHIAALDGEGHVDIPGVDAGTVPLLLQGLVPTEAWMALGPKSRLVARDPRTTRETTFRGPGRVRACVDYTEESWLMGGTFQSSVGAGESPGAEEWVVTPSAVVRYVAASVTLTVGRGLDVLLESGSAFAWSASPGDAALEEGWLRLPEGKTHLPAHDEPASAALDRCTTLAATAHTLAAQVMAPGGGVEAGVILEQVTARRTARAACAIATMRVGALPPPEAAPLLHGLAEANSAWSGVPVGSPTAGPR